VAAEDRAGAPKATILVVDDDVLIAMSTVGMLEDLGHEVLEANSGETALEILRQGRPVDLLITDYSMPRMTGAQLAKAARQILPDLPILLATGYAELPQGFDMELPRLGKPYMQEQLAAEIAKVLKAKAA
jgi:CheY-like chemotaxis protein